MIDYLKDILAHTHSLGCVDLIKMTGTETSTTLEGLASDRSVVITAKFHNPILELRGTIGFPNMGTLKTIVGIDEYAENAVITVKTTKDKGPVSLDFTNSTGDFKNSYRFMSKEIIEEQLKTVTFKGVTWHVELAPSLVSIQRLKSMASANSTETTFLAKTDGSDLVFLFGDESTHSGKFTFATDVAGELKRAWHWPVAHVINILSLPGDKIFRFSDDGAAEIVVDSGLAVYSYLLPAQAK